LRPDKRRITKIRLPANHPSGFSGTTRTRTDSPTSKNKKRNVGALIVDGLLDSFRHSDICRNDCCCLKDLQVQNEHVLLTHIGANTIRTINGIVTR